LFLAFLKKEKAFKTDHYDWIHSCLLGWYGGDAMASSLIVFE